MLIPRGRVGTQTKWPLPRKLFQKVGLEYPQRAHDVYATSAQRRCNVMALHRWGDVVLTSCACWVNVCGRGHRGPVYGFLVFWLHITIEPFGLFHHNVCDCLCFTMMVDWRVRETLRQPNTPLPPSPPPPQLFFYWPFQGDSSVVVLLLFFFCSCIVRFRCIVCFVIVCYWSLPVLVPGGPSFVIEHFLCIFTYILLGRRFT